MNKQVCLVVVLLVILVIVVVSMDMRLQRIESIVEDRPGTIHDGNVTYLSIYNTSIRIEKVEGNGNAFGDGNRIEIIPA